MMLRYSSVISARVQSKMARARDLRERQDEWMDRARDSTNIDDAIHMAERAGYYRGLADKDAEMEILERALVEAEARHEKLINSVANMTLTTQIPQFFDGIVPKKDDES